MKNNIWALGLMLTLASCSQIRKTNHQEGEIVSSTDAQTFHAKYDGKDQLRVGDRISILQYEDFTQDLRLRESRNMPLSSSHEKKKKIIGKATVSSILNDNFYELKLDQPQHIPSEAFIEKL